MNMEEQCEEITKVLSSVPIGTHLHVFDTSNGDPEHVLMRKVDTDHWIVVAENATKWPTHRELAIAMIQYNVTWRLS